MVRVQVTTGSKHGPQKLQLSARGPYRVLEVLSDNTYLIRRLPFELDSPREQGKPYKETAARMEKLPSALVIHRPVDGVDTRWASFRNAFSNSPLQHTLGVSGFGKFEAAPSTSKFAYQRIEELWHELSTEEEEGFKPTLATTERAEQVTGPGESPAIDKKREASPFQGDTRRHKTVQFSEPTVQGLAIPPSKAKSNQFRDDVIQSRDKLVFVWYSVPGTFVKRWYLVQIHFPNNHAIAVFLRTGRARCHWYIRHFLDSKKMPVELCRYWPEIHILNKGNLLGRIVSVKPSKAADFLLRNQKRTKHARFELDLDIEVHKIHGPFNFKDAQNSSNGERHNTIDRMHWKALKEGIKEKGIDDGKLGQTYPLLMTS